VNFGARAEAPEQTTQGRSHSKQIAERGRLSHEILGAVHKLRIPGLASAAERNFRGELGCRLFYLFSGEALRGGR
jgi:hypothetical protein